MRGTECSGGNEPKLFDAEHEKKRKEQLKRLFERTPEQVSVKKRFDRRQSNNRRFIVHKLKRKG